MKQKLLFIVSLILAFPLFASAHENYVLTQAEIDAGMNDWSINVLSALKDPANIRLSLVIGALITLSFAAYYFFEKSRFGIWLDEKLQKAEPFGHVVLRIALAVSFLASAYTMSYLGPEISVFSLPLGSLVHYLLYILGLMFLFGLYAEITAAVSLVIILLATFVYKDYMLTYFNYFGEFLALMFFGSRIFSADRMLFGLKTISENYKKWEIAIIRITYGVSILYPAISIKLLHPSIIIEIVNRYHLTNYSWLFPHDPLLISLGSSLLQVVIGLFLIFGFVTRLSTLTTFVLMILSVVFFQEAVWPHYILLALAFYLMINNGGELSLDHKIMKKAKAALD